VKDGTIGWLRLRSDPPLRVMTILPHPPLSLTIYTEAICLFATQATPRSGNLLTLTVREDWPQFLKSRIKLNLSSCSRAFLRWLKWLSAQFSKKHPLTAISSRGPARVSARVSPPKCCSVMSQNCEQTIGTTRGSFLVYILFETRLSNHYCSPLKKYLSNSLVMSRRWLALQIARLSIWWRASRLQRLKGRSNLGARELFASWNEWACTSKVCRQEVVDKTRHQSLVQKSDCWNSTEKYFPRFNVTSTLPTLKKLNNPRRWLATSALWSWIWDKGGRLMTTKACRSILWALMSAGRLLTAWESLKQTTNFTQTWFASTWSTGRPRLRAAASRSSFSSHAPGSI